MRQVAAAGSNIRYYAANYKLLEAGQAKKSKPENLCTACCKLSGLLSGNSDGGVFIFSADPLFPLIIYL
jgi:hypothetical protein